MNMNKTDRRSMTDSKATVHHASQMKGKTGIRRIIKATGYSCDGFKSAYRTEAAFRQVLWLNVLLVVALCFMPLAIHIKMILLIVSALSLIVELLNTGLEAVVDRISGEYHPLSKIAKDVGSAAQMIVLMLQFVLWCMALYLVLSFG